jgi:hypothetical protein
VGNVVLGACRDQRSRSNSQIQTIQDQEVKEPFVWKGVCANFQGRHHTRSLCQIFHNGVVLGSPHIQIMRIFHERPFGDVFHCFSHRIMNMERNWWVCGLFSHFVIFWHSLISSPGHYRRIAFQHVEIHD